MAVKKKAVAEQIVLEFEFDRETKGTVRYNEILEEGVTRGTVGTLYLLKETLDKNGFNYTDNVSVTVKAS